MPAKAKVVDTSKFVTLAKSIKEKHALINRESDEIDTLKTELTELAKAEFYACIKSKYTNGKPSTVLPGVPEVFGNFEIPVDNNDKVSVNFQTGSKTFASIDGKPATSVLKGMFGAESYGKVFTESTTHKVNATDEALDQQEEQHPEFFGYSIRPDAEVEKLRKLRAEYPELFNRTVVNLDGYALAYPDSVDSETKVAIAAGFIENVGKVNAAALENAKKFLAGFFGATLKVVIKCGNANKK